MAETDSPMQVLRHGTHTQLIQTVEVRLANFTYLWLTPNPQTMTTQNDNLIATGSSSGKYDIYIWRKSVSLLALRLGHKERVLLCTITLGEYHHMIYQSCTHHMYIVCTHASCGCHHHLHCLAITSLWVSQVSFCETFYMWSLWLFYSISILLFLFVCTSLSHFSWEVYIYSTILHLSVLPPLCSSLQIRTWCKALAQHISWS